MPLVKAKCTSCGVSLEVDDSKEAAVCPACGTPYIVEKAIYNYTTNNSINAETVNIINGKEDFTIVAGVLKKYTGKESEITIPDEVVSIGNSSIPKGITVVNFTENSKLKEICDGAFSECCMNLLSISIPSGVTTIGGYAFEKCVKLVSISIPSTVKKIGVGAFRKCRSLESVRMPDTIEKLEDTFTDCSSLKTVDIYAASSGEVENKSIWISAFSGCASLKYMRIPSTVKRLGEEESKIKEKVGGGSFVNDEGEIEYTRGYLFDEYYKTNSYPTDTPYNGDVFENCKSLERVDIDNDYGLKIVRSTFRGCENLKEIYSKNPDKVTYYYVEDDGSFNKTYTYYFHNLVTKGGNVLNDTFSRARRSSLYSNTELPPLQTNFPQPAPKPVAQPSGPCYVATCVYGSYDCPQVWTLRRWRDNTLAETWYGRAFIHVYYSISPTLVRWFGKTKWFKRMWQGKLDRMVKNLNAKGVEDTPYQDKKW